MPDDLTPPPQTADLTRLGDDDQYERAIVLLASVTDDLLDAVKEMDDADVRVPSLCPGWSRGHVLTHVARNADACRNLVEWASTGTESPMYASTEVRDADIEAGAGRSAAELEADVESSAERLLSALAGLPLERRHVPVRGGSGREMPAHDVLWMRIREVAYHLVDLRCGVRFADLPAPVVARGLPEAVERVGFDPADRGVSGPDAELLGWLTGREAGTGLASQGPLPSLPAWG